MPDSPGWYKDPWSRFESRWFDGTDWTDLVEEAPGLPGVDPPGVRVAPINASLEPLVPEERTTWERFRELPPAGQVAVWCALAAVLLLLIAGLVTLLNNDDDEATIGSAPDTSGVDSTTTTTTTLFATTTTELGGVPIITVPAQTTMPPTTLVDTTAVETTVETVIDIPPDARSDLHGWSVRMAEGIIAFQNVVTVRIHVNGRPSVCRMDVEAETAEAAERIATARMLEFGAALDFSQTISGTDATDDLERISLRQRLGER